MSVSELSIRRPVLAAVVSLLLVVFGLAALDRIPVRELPDIDAAVVTITTSYPGASPAAVDTAVTEIIDAAVAGIAGIDSIRSSSQFARSRTVLEFTPGYSMEAAANDVRDAIGAVRARLPDDAEEPRVIKNDSDSDPVMRLAITSSTSDAAAITDYVERNIADRISTVDGVASVNVYGKRSGAMRVWLDRVAMAAQRVTVSDIETALRKTSIELPAGQLSSEMRQFAVRLNSRINSLDEFRRVVVSDNGGQPVRLGDVARIERGVVNVDAIVRNNGESAVGISVIRQSQSNTIAISNAVREELRRITPTLPEGMRIQVGSDDAIFVKASIREVIVALLLSLLLVVLVIFVFLRSVRTTLIPAITIPVSLIGSFGLIYLLGFSINVLTLLALLLAIGLVVDDAIVMLENIERRRATGESLLQASVLGARQVTFAIIATSVTLIAVFVPISFMQGAAGRLFAEFGFVLASCVVVSTLVALTACPALASRILKAQGSATDAARAIDTEANQQADKGSGNWLQRRYQSALELTLRMPLVVVACALLFSAGGWLVYQSLERELTPSEDRGVLFVPLTTPLGSTLENTSKLALELETLLTPKQKELGVDTVFSYTGGRGRTHRSFIVLRLSPWDQRELGHNEITRRIAPLANSLAGAKGRPFGPNGLGLRGSRTPLRVIVGGPDLQSAQRYAETLLDRAGDNPGLVNLAMNAEPNVPQVTVSVDRLRADELGVSASAIGATLQAFLNSREVSSFLDRGREYPVIMQAEPQDRRTPDDIRRLLVRSDKTGQLLQLGEVTRITEEAASYQLNRYNRKASITVTGSLADNYSMGEAIDYMRDLSVDALPADATISFGGQAKQYLETSSGMVMVFALALLIVYLVLAAQFESFIHPLIIMLSVPLALASAIYALWLTGNTLNIYSQIGFVLLVGLMAKNGILIVEFANQLRDKGHSVHEAVVQASVIRLRPILMTVISTVLGAMPLVLATGAGAESRYAIGIVIIAGLALASLMTLFLTPVLYNLLAGLVAPRASIEQRLVTELGR